MPFSASFVFVGTVESFDQDSFKANLAKQLEGVDPDDINLIITAASISVEAVIRAPADATKQAEVLAKLKEKQQKNAAETLAILAARSTANRATIASAGATTP